MITTTFRPGDIIRVHQKIQEGDKTRIQVFEGTVLDIRGSGDNKSFTVRKLVGNVAVEKVIPFASPLAEKVEVVGHIKAKVRQANLLYLRKVK